MSAINTLTFPSGRNVKRLKQDAKEVAKQHNIPLHSALDQLARLHGGSGNWSQSIRKLRSEHSTSTTPLKPVRTQSPLATELGITDDELDLLTWEIQPNTSHDGLIYDYVLTFDNDNPPELLRKIRGLNEGNNVRVSTNAFDNPPESHKDGTGPIVVKIDMNPYRKLLVLGLNEIISSGLLNLEWDGSSDEPSSHLQTMIAGHNSIVTWAGAGFGEIKIAVWWKYDHSKHPQANLEGKFRESFSFSHPLAKRHHYRKFVGVVCSAWLERKEGKYLQGKGNEHLPDKYARKGELEILKALQNPAPLGFVPEGRFHM